MWRYICLYMLVTTCWMLPECIGENTEQVFLNINEQKIFNLNTMYRDLDKLVILNDSPNGEVFGQIRESKVAMSSPIVISFSYLRDYVVLENDQFSSFVRVALMGLYGGKFWLNIVDFPKYSSSPVKAKIAAQQELFSDDDSPNTKQCYSVDFLEPNKVLVDCAYEASPQVVENVFYVIEFDNDVTTTTKYPNLNVGQINSVQDRKIRIVDVGEDVLVVRGHLKVDPSHQNATYIEVFKYSEDAIQLEKTIGSDTESVAWNVQDFVVNDFDLVVLANGRFVVHPLNVLLEAMTQRVIQVENRLAGAFALDESTDNKYSIYAASAGDVFLYQEITKKWTPVYASNITIDSLQIASEYILANQHNQTLIIEKSSNFLRITVPQSLGGVLLSTSIENEVIQVTGMTVMHGEILPKQLILQSSTPTLKPITLQVLAEGIKSQDCVARFEITIEEANPKKLVSVVEEKRPLYQLASSEIRWTTRDCTIPYSELVTGPDVTYVEPDDNDESLVNVDFLDNDYYDLADYDVKLDNSSKVLAMHKLTGTTVQAFVQLNDEVNIFDCVLVSDDSYYIDNVQCIPYTDVQISALNLTKFQSEYCSDNNHTTIAVTHANQPPRFYLLTRKGPGAGTLQKIQANITGSTWLVGTHFLASFDTGISDLYIYNLNTTARSYETGVLIRQQHFFDLLDVTDPLPWCIAVSNHHIFISTHKAIIQIELDADEWVLSDVFPIVDKFDDFKFCYHINKQLFVGDGKQIILYGMSNQLYRRGPLNLYNFKINDTFASHRSLYLSLVDGTIVQYLADPEQSLSSSLQRILPQTENPQLSVVALNDKELLYIGTSDSHGLQVLTNIKRLVVIFDEASNDFVININFNATFTNWLNQSITIKKVEQVVSAEPRITARNASKSFTIEPRNKSFEVYIDPSTMFSGPTASMYLQENNVDGFEFNDRVHSVGQSVVDSLVDFTFFTTEKQELQTMVMTNSSLRPMKADLTKPGREITLLTDTKYVTLGSIHHDKSANTIHVVSFDSKRRPDSIFYGDLSNGLAALTFNQIHLQQDWQRVVKTHSVGPYLVVLYNSFDETVLQVLQPSKNGVSVVLNQTLNQYNVTAVDFDAHVTDTTLHILLLDADHGVSILEYTKTLRGRVLQLSQVKVFAIRNELIHTYKQPIFADTKFNGIHSLKDLPDKNNLIRAFITTNNALQYQLNFDTKGTAFSYVNAFMRLGDQVTQPQAITYIPQMNTIAVVYLDNSYDQTYDTAFYNLTEAHVGEKAVPYYQTLDVSSRIGQNYIKSVGSLGKPLTQSQKSDLSERPLFEKRESLLEGGFVVRDTDQQDMYVLYEIQELPGIVIVDGKLNGTQNLHVVAESINLQQAVFPVSVLLDPEHHQSKHNSQQENSFKTSSLSDRFQKLLQNEEFISFLFILAGLAIFLITFFLVRCIRRSHLLKRLRRTANGDEPQEFSSEHL